MSNKSVAIHQPNFLPWVGYFHKIFKVDLFVLLDNVQYPRGKSFGNRVLIKSNEQELWINIPVINKSELFKFNEIEINNQVNWSKKLLKTLFLSYKKSQYFDFFYSDLEEILSTEYRLLTDLNKDLINLCCSKIGIESQIINSSEITDCKDFSGEDKIIGLLKYFKAISYLTGSGAGSKRYINESHFTEAGIQLDWQSINPEIPYPQLGSTFIPRLSIIDLIFNQGPDSISYLKKL